MGSRILEWIETNAPVLIGVVTGVCSWIFLFMGKVSLSFAFLSSFSSVVVQILGTYVGLVLTSYAILHSVKFDTPSDSGAKKSVNELLKLLHGTFVYTVQYLVAATLIVFAIFVIATMATQPDSNLQNIFPGWGLIRISVSAVIGLMVFGSMEIFFAVRTLYNIRVNA